VYKSLDRKDIPAILAKGIETPRYPGFAKESTEGTAVKATLPNLDIEKLLSGIENEEEAPAFDEPDDPILVDSGIVASDADKETIEEKETEVDPTEEKETTPAEETAESVTVSKDALDAIAAAEERHDHAHEVPLAVLDKAKFESAPVPADVQLFNVLAERLGQPVITLDGHGNVQAVNASPELTSESIQEAIAKAMNFGETIKAGSEFNKKNQQTLQSLHNSIVDMCKSQFHPCEEMDDGSDDEGDDKQLSLPLDIKSEIEPLAKQVGMLIETLSKHGIEPKAIKALQSQIDAEQRRIKELQATTKEAEERLAKLQNAPLGQPTLLKRGIRDNGDTVTHQDFKALSSTSTMNDNERRWSLEEALKETVVVPRTLAGGETMNYRKWPEGVGGSVKDGVRPPLTGTQKTWMHPAEMLSYNDGSEAAVPCYDDPGGVSA